MSIPVTIDPLGTLGGVTLLDGVHVTCAEDAPYENMVQTAFGEPYYLEPFGSAGYFAEVAVDNVSGMNVGTRKAFVSVGGYIANQIGSLVFYSWGALADNIVAHPQQYDILAVNSIGGYSYLVDYHFDGRLNNFNIQHKVENGIYSGVSPLRTVSYSLGTWTTAQSTRMQIYISKIPGLSYDFKKLVAHTENVKFDALPARKNGKDGIAIFINDRLEKFIVV